MRATARLLMLLVLGTLLCTGTGRGTGRGTRPRSLRAPLPHRTRSASDAATDPPLAAAPYNLSHAHSAALQNFAFFYLQNTLRLSEPALMRLVLRQSGVLYLKPDTNLAPTLEAFRAFGFQDKDVRKMVEAVPSVLAINHEWTLPEKLISLQTCFRLSRRQLVRMCTRQPFALTSSIRRNLAVMEFLEDAVQLSDQQMGALASQHPRVLTTSLHTLRACWLLLVDTYGLDEAEARALVLRHPALLSPAALRRHGERVLFFGSDLALPPPFSDMQRLALKTPALLTADLGFFLQPNLALLNSYLSLGRAQTSKLVQRHPAVLLHNPRTLERRLRGLLLQLTGNASHYPAQEETDEPSSRRRGGAVPEEEGEEEGEEGELRWGEPPSEDAVIDTLLGAVALSAYSLEVPQGLAVYMEGGALLEGGALDQTPSADLIFDIVYGREARPSLGGFSEEALDSLSAGLFSRAVDRLLLPEARAIGVCLAVPWVLSMRPERTARLLQALAVSLGMTRAEVSKSVATYPRLLCLSAEGKVAAVLRMLAMGAVDWLAKGGASGSAGRPDAEADQTELRGVGLEEEEAMRFRREDPVRALVRSLVVRYPLIIGTSLERIGAAVDEVVQTQVGFGDVIKCIRRLPPRTSRSPRARRSNGTFEVVLDLLLLD